MTKQKEITVKIDKPLLADIELSLNDKQTLDERINELLRFALRMETLDDTQENDNFDDEEAD